MSQPRRWVAKSVKNHDHVCDVAVVASHVLKIEREQDSFLLGTIGVECVQGAMLRTLWAPETLEELSFVVNIPKECCWTDSAIELMSRYSIAFGGMAELYSALGSCMSVHQYRKSEFAFVEEVLGQHDVVATMIRKGDRKYVLERRQGLRDFTIVLLNEYEVTKDHVRVAVRRYKPFDAILMTNPNGGATSQATEDAEFLGIHICKIKQLMGMINGP